MISAATLQAAIERQVITSAQADVLRQLERDLTPVLAEAPDDEKFRFISGFSDIFVTIGLGLFLGAAGYFLALIAGPFGLSIGLAAAAWALAELFTRRMRMALPSIVLLLVFAVASLFGIALIFGVVANAAGLVARAGSRLPGLGNFHPATLTLAALATCGLIRLHYRRFQVPVTIAAGVGAMALGLYMLALTIAPDFTLAASRAITLLLGLGIFALAMRYDASDRLRETRRADIAFWLHLLAAPMIVHSLIGSLFNSGLAELRTADALRIFGVFLVLGLVAVLIDRRAILVSGLSYAGFAIGTVLKSAAGIRETVPLTLLALGAFILLLSAGWRPLRARVLSSVPASVLRWFPPATGVSTS